MQATIGVWSPTLLEVKLHSVPASLLVSTCTSCWYDTKTLHSTVNVIMFQCPAAELADLVSELHEVNDWVTFGLYLGIKIWRLRAIEKECQTIGERRTQMLEEWQNNEIPTWSAVVQALVGIGMRRLASEIAQTHGWFIVMIKYIPRHFIPVVCHCRSSSSQVVR